MPLAMALIAFAALCVAWIAEFGFGLEPCILCLYQRVPFYIVVALGLIGFVASFKTEKFAPWIMGLIGITFLLNAALAIYHTGVERLWWKSHFEGCAVPDLGSDPSNILAVLEQTQAARCDEIAWSDPILDLSMANYNIPFCLGLAIIAFISVKMIRK